MCFLQLFDDQAVSAHFLDLEISRVGWPGWICRNGRPLRAAKIHTGRAVSIPPYHVNCLANVQVDIGVGVGCQRGWTLASVPVPHSDRTATDGRSQQHLANDRHPHVRAQRTGAEPQRQHEQLKSTRHQLNGDCAAGQNPPDRRCIHSFPFFDVAPLYFQSRRHWASELTQDILTLRSLQKVFVLPAGGLASEIGENCRLAYLQIAHTLIFIDG